jgi:hypothetical protein
MPIMKITEAVGLPSGTRWLTSAASPKVPNTPDRASRTGIPAATTAPNATSKMASVTGSDRYPARWRSCAMVPLSARLPLAVPNSSIKNPGLERARACTADWTGTTLPAASSELPAISNWTKAEWPSGETRLRPPEPSGDRTLVTSRRVPRRATTAAAAARKAGSRTVAAGLCTSTLSPAGWGNSRARMRSATPDSPAA